MINAEWSPISVGDWGVYQHRDGLRYSVDSYLLAHFAAPEEGETIYDVGTGMGIVAILLAAKLRQARILGLELQPELTALAEASRVRNGIDSEKLSFRTCDVRTPPPELFGKADLVTANPPFYRLGHGAPSENRERYLGRHEVAMDLDILCRAAARFLRRRGRLVLVYRVDRIDAAMAAATAARLKPVCLQPLYPRAGADANLAVLTCVLEGRGTFRMTPPFYINDAEGKVNPALLAAYGKE